MNFGLRLDEILKTSHHRIRTRILRDAEIYQSHIAESEYDAKQALTSLIKELVAEAKPEEYEDYYASNPVEKGRKMGYNEAVREFEQNLLKALEEV